MEEEVNLIATKNKALKDAEQKRIKLQQELSSLSKQVEDMRNVLAFAKAATTPLWDVNRSGTKTTTRFTRFTKEQVLEYMTSPSSNEKNIRDASIYMFDASTQYRRLITYYSVLPTWAYVMAPLNYNKDKIKPETFQKLYYKATVAIENMNLAHEMPKATMIALRDGIFYGAIWKTNNSFYLQRINPDYCTLTSINDGTWMYSVDMSKIKEEDLMMYPPEFTDMYRAYKSSGQKLQEVPPTISFCLKADETTIGYSIPPFASTLPMIYDIETYKALQETATELNNYKVLAMQIPLKDDGTPTMDWPEAHQYYQHMANALPPAVGAFMSPMSVSDFSFERSGNTAEVDTVSRAEEQYWANTGTSPLLHGSTSNATAGVLKLAVKADEEIILPIIRQVERLINRILKTMSGSLKFKVHILPVTIFNRDEMISSYKDAATLGVPGSKAAFAAATGIPQSDLLGMNDLELNLIGVEDWVPLKTTYTQGDGSDEGGRPELDDDDLTDEGEKTRDKESNENT